MELGTLDFWYANREWQVLVGGRVQKIYLKGSMHVLQIYSKKLYQLICMPGAAFFSSAKLQFPTTPGGYTMFLRKRLTGGRIARVDLLGFDRIITFTIETKEGPLEFIIELFDDVNSMVVKDGKIVSAKYYREYADRVIRGGQPYTPPPSKPAPWDAAIVDLLGKPAGRAVAVELGLGGKWSDEITARAHIDRQQPLHEKQLIALRTAIGELQTHPVQAAHTDTDAYPFAFASKSETTSPSASFNEAIDAVLSRKLEVAEQSQQDVVHAQRRTKQQKIIEAQQAQLASLDAQANEQQRAGELIYEHYAELQTLLNAISAEWRKKSLKELQEQYADHPLVRAIHPDGTIEVEF